MTKTTFLGYVPSLKSKHEATIVNGRAMKSKGGSIRYLLEGEYDGRKTLPKTVSKEDFVKVYGFDAKEAEAVIISGTKGDKRESRLHIVGDKDGDGFTPKEIRDFDTNKLTPMETKISKRVSDNYDADTVGSPSPTSVEPPAPSEKPFPQEPSNENFSAEDEEEVWEYHVYVSDSPTDDIFIVDDARDFGTQEGAIKAAHEVSKDKRGKGKMVYVVAEEREMDIEEVIYRIDEEGDVLNAETEVKEALGLFGKKDEKEEKEEPKTQEFTVVLQEGDKLELTDIEEEDEAPEDEKTEKEAETLEITDIDWETDDEDVDLPASVLIPSSVVEDEIADYLSDEYGFLVRGYVLNAETYEAVQAKVTRPVKEEEKEESDEGLSTGAKVALGVGALAAGVALFGAEGEYPQEFLDEFYDFDSNPTADTQDEETIAIAYAAWLESKKNEDDWEMIECGNCDETFAIDEGLDIGGIDYCEECYDTRMSKENQDYIPYESETDYSRIYEATSGEGYINHDPIYQDEDRRVEIKYDDPTTYYDWNSQDEVDEDEVEEAIKEELGNEPGTGAYGATLEVRSALNPDKYVDVDVDMDTDYNEGRFMGMAAEHESESDGYTYAYTKGHKDGMDNEVIYRPSIETDREKTIFKKILKQKADTVGNPSPSGPSSTPEPAEATGSEPSNEHMEAEGSNMKMAMGVLALGVGAVALLGGDRIKKIFDRFNL